VGGEERFAGVNVNYRLAPQAMWPAGAEDVAGVVQWVSDNIAARVAMLPGSICWPLRRCGACRKLRVASGIP